MGFRVLPMAMVGALLLAGAACGGDDDEEGATATTEQGDDTATTTGGDTTDDTSDADGGDEPSGEPVKVMIVFEETGPAESPELEEGAIAGIEVVNANGGVHGRPVELITCETHNDPNAAAECGRQAVAEGVVAVVGELSIFSDHVAILEENNIPLIGSTTSGADFTSPAMFPLFGSTPVNIPAMANALVELGHDKISMARVEIDGGEALAGFADTGLEERGLEINNDVGIPVGTTDMAPYVQAVLANDTNAVIVGLPGAQATPFITELRATDPDIPIAMLGTRRELVFDALGDDANGIIEALFFLPPTYENDATRQYVEAMDEAGFDDNRGFRINAYGAVLAFADAANRLEGDLTAEALFEFLPTIEDLDIGLTPPIQWAEGGVGGLDRVFSSCAFITEIEDGSQVPVFDTFRDAFTFEECPTPAAG